MPRTKLSNLAHIRDLANEIIKAVEGTQELYDKLARDSERLKEIEPALKKIREIAPAPVNATAPGPGETPPTVAEKQDTPIKRARHIKKKIAEEPDATESNSVPGE